MTDPSTLKSGFEGLVEIFRTLRGPEGCPWDRAQTHQSLLPYLREESVEVAEAVAANDPLHLAEELGDVLLQVLLHAQIAAESGAFTIDDVIKILSEKMIRRHPHVFGNAQVENSNEVIAQWEKIKAEEKLKAGGNLQVSLLDKVSKDQPALSRAQELQRRAAKAGFRWPNLIQALAKVHEELSEFLGEDPSSPKQQEELGDLLFAVVALGREAGLSAEEALVQGNAKFERRFRALERHAGGSDSLKALGKDELLSLWERTKTTNTPQNALA
ncbi:MAG: nucleoside triphosphate pyrophosphohydrolase [Spirochaetales bacterium]|nr:nucleoside triphosphate pyrophosphohydrolase [Spirochaetales bacterium]